MGHKCNGKWFIREHLVPAQTTSISRLISVCVLTWQYFDCYSCERPGLCGCGSLSREGIDCVTSSNHNAACSRSSSTIGVTCNSLRTTVVRGSFSSRGTESLFETNCHIFSRLAAFSLLDPVPTAQRSRQDTLPARKTQASSQKSSWPHPGVQMHPHADRSLRHGITLGCNYSIDTYTHAWDTDTENCRSPRAKPPRDRFPK